MILQQITSSVDDSTSVYIMASAGLAGPIGILRLDPDGYIMSVFVIEECRGRGHGSAMIERACEVCRERGCEIIGLSVANDNPRALQLYRKLGFKKYTAGHEGYTQYIKQLA